LPLTLIGLTHNITLTSARRAATTVYTHITKELSLDRATNGQRSAEARIQAIREDYPETILLVGGADGGAERPLLEIATNIAMALRISPEAAKPNLLFAGNVELRDQVTEILGEITHLRMVDNVRPSLDVENLAPTQMELEQLYTHYRMALLPGLEKLGKWSGLPIIPASRSFEKVIAYLGRQNNLNVVGVDIGSQATVIATQAQRAHHTTTVRTDAGVGHSLASLLKAVPLEKFQRWLPFEIELEELHNRLLNKTLHPASLPDDEEALLLEYAIAREALRLVLDQAQAGWQQGTTSGRWAIPWNLLLGGGRTLTHTPNPAYAALVLLDGFEPWGVTKLVLDINGVLNVLGTIAGLEPLAAVEVAAQPYTFLNLGTVIAPLGHGPEGKKALNLRVIETDNEPIELDVPYGSLEVVPLSPGQKVTVEMRPTRYFDIGLGQPGRGAVAEIEAGLLGLIVDARGRPLRLPQDDEVRRARLQQWLLDLGLRKEENQESQS
jgi:hypothetical protein